MHKEFDPRLEQAWWALRIGLGIGPFLAGLDKYFNLLANWPEYMSPLALKVLPFSAQTFMHIVGVIEMVVGLAILTKWTRLGSYVASVWLLAMPACVGHIPAGKRKSASSTVRGSQSSCMPV